MHVNLQILNYIDLATPLIAKRRTATASYRGTIGRVSAQGTMGLAIGLFARRIETPGYEAGTASNFGLPFITGVERGLGLGLRLRCLHHPSPVENVDRTDLN